jgi:tetratricopeptide (TPR) repeat protein
MGNFNDAEQLRRKAIEIRRQSFGSDDPAEQVILTDLAYLYKKESRYIEALELLKKVLETRIRTLGANYADTLVTQNDLGDVYQALLQPRDAAGKYEIALRGSLDALGLIDPVTLTSVGRLSALYQKYPSMGTLVERENVQHRLLEAKKVLEMKQNQENRSTSPVDDALNKRPVGTVAFTPPR